MSRRAPADSHRLVSLSPDRSLSWGALALAAGLALGAVGCASPGGRQEPPPGVPDAGDALFDETFCQDPDSDTDGDGQADGRASGPQSAKVSGSFSGIPFSAQVNVMIACRDGSCWKCEDGTTNVDLRVEGEGSDPLGLLKATIAPTFTQIPNVATTGNGCVTTPFELKDVPVTATTNRPGLMLMGFVDVKGYVVMCCESGRACARVLITDYTIKEKPSAPPPQPPEEGGGGQADAGAAEPNAGLVRVRVDLGAAGLVYTPLDPATGEPYQVLDPDTGELRDHQVPIEDPFQVYEDASNGPNRFRLAYPRRFIRGEVNGDWTVNVADAVTILTFLYDPAFEGTPHLDAMDVDDDGAVTVRDAVALLLYLFWNGRTPPYPFHLAEGQALEAAADFDPTPDALPEVYMWLYVPPDLLEAYRQP